mgnify:CR=1 FL=1|tara:strand:- start:637 stop:1464 length:828 start_codon:yes stop_codon:yes gene_type:complete
MKKIFLTIAVLLSSCSTDLDTYQGYSTDFRNKSYLDKKHVGSSCDNDCIYSSYAVTHNIQNKQYDCIEGPCACVKEGEAYTLCNASPEPENLWAQETTNQQNNVQQSINVPYYNQYDNKHYPYSTCQNTSIAMILSHFQSDIHPDTIFNRWGKDMAQSPSGLNYIYKHYASSSSINTYTNASPEDLRNALSQGYIAIVHGYFTTYGHVLVVRSFDSQGYHVNDPAGKWSGCFKCGYTSGVYDGVTRYSRQAFENAVFTSDGSTYLPGWIHLIKGQ